MSRMYKKRRPQKKTNCNDPTLQIVGLILLAFGIITICAFLLPIKAWIFVLGCLLLLCGIVLVIN